MEEIVTRETLWIDIPDQTKVKTVVDLAKGGGGGGTGDYNDLDNKPQIGGVTISGNRQPSEYGLQSSLSSAQLANIEAVPSKANQSALASEVSRATNAELANTSAIEDEVIRAKAEEESLGVLIDAVEVSVSSEATRAKAEESRLSDVIAAESTRAIAAEEANSVAIEGEETRATTAESALATRIDATETAIDAADAAITAEVARAQAAEAAIVAAMPDGAARMLPPYLHALDFDATYPEDAQWLYDQLGPSDLGRCSAVRREDKLYRKYDWIFDYAAEFAVKVNGNATRFTSWGMASVGSRLTETEVTSGKWSRYFKCLPGMTLDGINEKGVVAEINVDGGPKDGWHGDAEDEGIHILAAVRWVLDHGETAAQAAEWIADHIIQPQGEMNFHFMVADATATYIVENGVAHDVTDGTKVLTNYALYDEAHAGGGKERYTLLVGGADISAVNFTNAYHSGNDWDSDFDSPEQHLEAIAQWAEQGDDKESHRGKTTESGKAWWQSVHTTEYDFATKTMRVAVQEDTVRFTFALPAAGGGGGVDPSAFDYVLKVDPETGNIYYDDGVEPNN